MPVLVDWIPQVITIGVVIYFFRDLKSDIREINSRVYDLGNRVSHIEGMLQGTERKIEGESNAPRP